MAAVTLQIVEGLERGATFRGLHTPVTIGREEENSLRLNDERVSRFHVKLQEDGGRILLTDLDSTNGTRVNGRPVSMRVLRPGDQIAVGRCVLTFGSPEEIAAALAAGEPAGASDPTPPADRTPPPAGGPAADATGSSASTGADDSDPPFLPPGTRPPIPADLDPGQTADLCDLLGHVHAHLVAAARAARDPAPGEAAGGQTGDGGPMPGRFVPAAAWQRLAGLTVDVAEALRVLRDPPR